jgi:hypothetical protein
VDEAFDSKIGRVVPFIVIPNHAYEVVISTAETIPSCYDAEEAEARTFAVGLKLLLFGPCHPRI